MEPMALGSPSSPSSPGVNPNFLPSFLMGDTQPNTNTANSVSPGRNRMPNLKLNFNTPLLNQSLNESYNRSPYPQSPFNNIQSERTGPPKRGLFDTVEPKKPTVLSSTVQYPTEPIHFIPNESLSTIKNDSFNQSLTSPIKEPLNKSACYPPLGNREQNETIWVTVFGFPPSAASLVLAQMASCGCISEKKFPTQGNWVHLKYSSPLEVHKALGLNGKLISTNIMIGVVPYINKSENKENLENLNSRTPIRARSLRQSYVSPQANSPVVPQNVPQKSTGLVTKAMEYVFGW